MIFTKATSWFQGQAVDKILFKPNLCYIQDIVDFDKSIFILADGLHFIIAIFENDSFFDMIQNFSIESFEMKGSIVLLNEYKFMYQNNKLEMRVFKCTYIGEDSLFSDTRDINKINNYKSIQNIKALENSKVYKYVDLNNIQTQDISVKHAKITNQGSYKIISDIDVSFQDDNSIISEFLSQKENIAKNDQKDIITESYIQSLGIEKNNSDVCNSSLIIQSFNFSKKLSLEDSLTLDLFAKTVLFQSKENKRENIGNESNIASKDILKSSYKEYSISGIENLIDLNSEDDFTSKIPKNTVELSYNIENQLDKKEIPLENTNNSESLTKSQNFKISLSLETNDIYSISNTQVNSQESASKSTASVCTEFSNFSLGVYSSIEDKMNIIRNNTNHLQTFYQNTKNSNSEIVFHKDNAQNTPMLYENMNNGFNRKFLIESQESYIDSNTENNFETNKQKSNGTSYLKRRDKLIEIDKNSSQTKKVIRRSILDQLIESVQLGRSSILLGDNIPMVKFKIPIIKIKKIINLSNDDTLKLQKTLSSSFLNKDKLHLNKDINTNQKFRFRNRKIILRKNLPYVNNKASKNLMQGNPRIKNHQMNKKLKKMSLRQSKIPIKRKFISFSPISSAFDDVEENSSLNILKDKSISPRSHEIKPQYKNLNETQISFKRKSLNINLNNNIVAISYFNNSYEKISFIRKSCKLFEIIKKKNEITQNSPQEIQETPGCFVDDKVDSGLYKNSEPIILSFNPDCLNSSSQNSSTQYIDFLENVGTLNLKDENVPIFDASEF